MVGGGLQAGVAGRFGCMGDKMMMYVDSILKMVCRCMCFIPCNFIVTVYYISLYIIKHAMKLLLNI